MRNDRTMKKVYFVGAILLMLCVVLTMVLLNNYNTSSTSTSAEDLEVIVSTYNSKDGYLYDPVQNTIINNANKFAKAEIAAFAPATTYYTKNSSGEYVQVTDTSGTPDANTTYYTVANANYYEQKNGTWHLKAESLATEYSGKSVTQISSAATLISYIKSATTNSVGVLMSNFAYDMRSYASNMSNTSISADFVGTLDGNGYKITMTAPNNKQSLDGQENSSYPGVINTVSGGSYDGYYYTGMLCAVNRGTIKNLNIDWNGNLNTNTTLTSGDGAGVLLVKGNHTNVSGLICGLNYNNATISNCNINLNCAYSVGKEANDSNTGAGQNSCIVGGIVGALHSGTIERCTLNNAKGVMALADGSRSGVVTKKAIAVAGGIAGVINNVSNARILNCSLYGKGSVVAECGHDVKNRNNDGSKGYCGGVTAGAFKMNSSTDWSLGNNALANGQIDGIISAWTGVAKFRWKDNDHNQLVSIPASLFGYVGNTDAVKHVVLLFDYFGQMDLLGYSTNYLDYGDSGSGAVLTYGTWAEVYAENFGGLVEVSYDYAKLVEKTYDKVDQAEGFDSNTNYYINTGTQDNPVYSKVTITAFDPSVTYYVQTTGNIIRIQAYVDGYNTTEIDDVTGYTMKTITGNGDFIWGLKKYEGSWRGADNAVAYDEFDATANCIAYVDYVNPETSGALVFVFGQKANLALEDTNREGEVSSYVQERVKRFDNTSFNLPSVVLTDNESNLLAVSEDAYSFEINYTFDDISGPTDDTKMYLPGSYTIRPAGNYDTANTYLYYDDVAYVLVDYKASIKYDYSILIDSDGVLFTSEASSNEVNWLQSDTINFNYGNLAGAIDYYTYKRGSFAAESELIAVDPTDTSYSIDVDTAGKTYYQINAYIDNPYYPLSANEYIKVGTTSVLVYIDNIAPLIEDVKYYKKDDTNSANHYLGSQVSEEDILNPAKYQNKNIIVAFKVKENGRSGISSGSGYTESIGVSGDQTWTCYVELTEDEPSRTVYFIDVAGNERTRTFATQIDTTDLQLDKVKALNSGVYLSYVGQLGYCPDTVKLTFTPVFGPAGATLQYSYEKDSYGNDIWVDYTLQEIKSSQPNTLVIDYKLDNAEFKMRLKSNLYPSYIVYANNANTTQGKVLSGDTNRNDNWNVDIVIAGIGIGLENLYYGSQALSSMTEEQRAALFNKPYDAKTTSDIVLDVKLYSTGTTPLNDKTSIVYSDLYTLSKPQILENKLKAIITYDSPNAGSRTVTIKVEGINDESGKYADKYLVRFIESAIANLNTLVNDMPKEKTITTNDYKAVISGFDWSIDLNDTDYKSLLGFSNEYSDLNASGDPYYVYGDVIPSQITVTGLAGEDVILRTFIVGQEDDDIGRLDADDYSLGAEILGGSDNYNFTATPIDFEVAKKRVAVAPALDGNTSFNTTIVFDGNSHIITGLYEDVDGNYKTTENGDVLITYYDVDPKTYTDAEPISQDEYIGVKSIGKYYAQIDLKDENYQVLNTKNPIEITIDKGFLNINITTKAKPQVEQYSASKKGYKIEPTIDVAKDVYDPTGEAFDIKYYLIENNVAGSTPVDPINVGEYLVLITYNGSTYFYPNNTYSNAYLTIEKATVEAVATDVEFDYDGQPHEVSIADSQFRVSASIKDGIDNIVIVKSGAIEYKVYDGISYSVATDISSNIVLKIYNESSRTYVDIDEENKPIYTNAGTYRLMVEFKDDDCFEDSYAIFNVKIKPAEFEGLSFECEPFYYIDSSAENYHSVELQGENLEQYLKAGAVINYVYRGTKYIDTGDKGVDVAANAQWSKSYNKISDTEYEEVIDGTPFEFNNVGEYKILVTISMPNYTTWSKETTISIQKTRMPRVTSEYFETEFDGSRHPATFKIAEHEYTAYYRPGYEDIKLIAYIMMGTDQITVKYSEDAAPVKAGTYQGTITLSSNNYADEIISTRITIKPKAVDNVSFDSLDIKLDSSMDLREIYPTFRNVKGELDYGTYEFYDSNDNKVELSNDGTLEPGTYIVRVTFEDGNYSTVQEAEITIAQASSKKGSNGGGSGSSSGSFMDIIQENMTYVIIGGAAVGVIVIAGIVIGVVKGKKAKGKKRSRKNPPPKKGAPPKQKPETAKQKTEAPIKKKTVDTNKDRAQF